MNKLITILCALLLAASVRADTIKDLVRIQGEQENVIFGLGLVFGLSGTGDSGKELITARPMAQLLINSGNAVGTIEELAATKSVALVMVKCTIPEGGGRTGDKFDIRVSTIGSAKSLEGGELFLAPLRYETRGPVELDRPMAMAQGTIVVSNPAVPTNAVVHGGARMLIDFAMRPPGPTFNLVVNQHFAGHSSTTAIASRINQEWFGTPDLFGPAVATVIDDRTIRIDVPQDQRTSSAAFIGEILGYQIDQRDLGLPAKIIVNRDTGVILVTADVRIGPVAITHKNLSITTIIPEPVATPEQPRVKQQEWTGLATNARQGEMARFEDLMAAMERLDVPVEDQIEILQSLHKTGRLQAQLIIE
ncbi:MAG: flagellar basal body P-ring protein FlgI [Phycisphaerales bacterium]|nr:flagellar basal body P-ring protein FlgI [Phycisphaerales bacterium]MCB9835630.1 flagellar basal body P-ring protein FlgI [Phycisphaera sp.]